MFSGYEPHVFSTVFQDLRCLVTRLLSYTLNILAPPALVRIQLKGTTTGVVM